MQEQQQQNTYVMEPREDERFYPSKVKAIVESVFKEKLAKEVFDPATAPQITEDLTKLIRIKIKNELKMPRYKICVQVLFGELRGQGVRVASKCLWDVAFDNHASFSYTNEKVYAVGIVYGTYYE